MRPSASILNGDQTLTGMRLKTVISVLTRRYVKVLMDGSMSMVMRVLLEN
jgi:hypothetical protein